MNRLLKRARSFLRSERGNVAMMFGLALVPLCIAAGVGLDYARGAVQHQQMADALDAAALAVGSATGMPPDKIQPLAQKYFDANYAGDKSGGTGPSVSLDSYVASPGSVTLHADYSLPTTLLNVVGIASMPVSASTTVVWGQSKLWVALVLDNSTSMNDGSGGNTKMKALQGAAQKLLLKLQSASATPGDVQVGIAPFTRIVNVDAANKDKSWIYWGYWEAQPANANLDNVTDNTGPGSSCPFTTSSKGYSCTGSTIPTTGMICPGMDNGKYNTERYNVYYNGCYNSTPTRTKVVTKTSSTPTTIKYSCKTVNGGAESCTQSSSNTGSATNNTATTYENGYTGDSTTTLAPSSSSSTSDGSKNCTTSRGTTTCTWTRTTVNTSTTGTEVRTASGPYLHKWVVNDHSTWTGCVMDRPQDDDISNTAPSGIHGFPAANLEMCYNSSGFKAKVTPLEYDWDALATQIGNMTPNGYTNQVIGMAHGWQMLTPGDPWGTPAVPQDTARYIILFSDGLNTQDRWYISSNPNVGDSRIDARLVKADALKANGVCDNAKADGIIIYSVFIHIGNEPDSASMKACASDASKYFNLTSADQIDAAFATIGQQITNVRVSR